MPTHVKHDPQVQSALAGAASGPTMNPQMPTLDDLHALAERPAVPTVSIYLPVKRNADGRHENQLRLRNLIHRAAGELITAADARTSADIADRLETLAGDPGLWAHPGNAMAVFATATWAQAFHLPLACPEFVAVGSRCHLKPLASILQCDGLFYLLVLSQHGVHLHQGSHFGMREIPLPGAPASIDEVFPPVASEHRVEVRTQHGAPSAAHFFAAPGDEHAKERIKAYFRRINACVCGLLHGGQAPLVIGGVGFLLPLYRAVNHYPHLMEQGVEGGALEGPGDHHLHERAWQVVAPHFGQSAVSARERLAQLGGTWKASADLKRILQATREGRVADLFIASDSVRWGSLDERDGRIREHRRRWTDDDDLLNLALIHALATRAHIHVLPREQLPEGSDIHAIYRY